MKDVSFLFLIIAVTPGKSFFRQSLVEAILWKISLNSAFLSGASKNNFYIPSVSQKELSWKWQCSWTQTRISAHQSKVKGKDSSGEVRSPHHHRYYCSSKKCLCPFPCQRHIDFGGTEHRPSISSVAFPRHQCVMGAHESMSE